MAGVGLLPGFRKLYRKAQEDVDKWKRLQGLGEAQLDTIANVLERLPILKDEANYGPCLSSIDGLPEKVYSKQLVSLESLFKSLLKTTDDMEKVVDSLGRAAQDAAKLGGPQGGGQQQAKAKAPPLSTTFEQLGASPSTGECVEGLQDIWTMLKSELALKRALVKAVTYNSTQAELAELSQCYAAQPNVRWGHVGDILYAVAATEPVERV